MTNRTIEIHDSQLRLITIGVGQVVLDFSSAYIHQSEGRPGIDAGTGWTQRAVIRVRGDVVSGSLTQLPCHLISGHLTLNGQRSDNLIPTPLSCNGEVEIYLTSVFGESIQVRGSEIALELLGEPEYAEKFPGVNSF